MSLLLPHTARWSTFRVNGAHLGYSVGTSELDQWRPSPHIFPSLERLSFRNPSFGTFTLEADVEDQLDAFYSLLDECRSLTSLSLIGFPHSDTAVTGLARLPWQQLTKVLIEVWPSPLTQYMPELPWRVLSQLTNVAVLRLHTTMTNGVTPKGPFLFPNLISLSLHSISVDWMLGNFVARRLEALHLHRYLHVNLHSLSAFVTRSRSHLQYLCLDSLTDPDFATRVLAELPALRMLSVVHGHPIPCIRILQCLIGENNLSEHIDVDAAHPCPKLEAIHLRFVEYFSGSPEEHNCAKHLSPFLKCIAQLLEARWPAPTSSSHSAVDLARPSTPTVDASYKPHLRFQVSSVENARVSKAYELLQRIRRAAGVADGGVIRVDVDVGIKDLYTQEDRSALWPKSRWSKFKPQIKPQMRVGSALARLKDFTAEEGIVLAV